MSPQRVAWIILFLLPLGSCRGAQSGDQGSYVVYAVNAQRDTRQTNSLPGMFADELPWFEWRLDSCERLPATSLESAPDQVGLQGEREAHGVWIAEDRLLLQVQFGPWYERDLLFILLRMGDHLADAMELGVWHYGDVVGDQYWHSSVAGTVWVGPAGRMTPSGLRLGIDLRLFENEQHSRFVSLQTMATYRNRGDSDQLIQLLQQFAGDPLDD